MERKIETQVKGFHAIDGGGVHLVRVLGNTTVKAFNPFLMLDSFDSTNPEDYVAGFPMHPHRGIETITFVAHGNMRHKDSMGFEDIVQDGEVQYMSAVGHPSRRNHPRVTADVRPSALAEPSGQG